MKYIVTFDPMEDLYEVEADDPSYDGPVSNVSDPEYVYHIEAETEDEAVAAASFEIEIDGDNISSLVELDSSFERS